MTYTRILGTGSYLPERVMTNAELEKIVDTSDEWIRTRTGIRTRHVAAEDDTALTMAFHAANAAMSAAQVTPQDIDMIIVATTTPDKVFPSTACLLQQKFNIGGAAAFDLNAVACAGFMYGLSIADKFIRTGSIKKALVIGSEVMSRIVDWNDRSTCVLFGDGAGAVVVGADSTPGILTTCLHADGRFADILYLPTNSGVPTQLAGKPVIHMSGNFLFRQAVNILGDLFDETLASGNIQASEVNWLVPHQANVRIIQAMAKKLNLPIERVAITLETQGNTSSASIPLALDTAIRDGRIQRGDCLLLEGFGGGLAWGSALIRY
ncbi:MAG: beta-ketoacyl-ACP synthase III [Gammaproteobacteria bacterium]|nr:beta-ketoacyl-ACP synthase III [Gammaproteobacteria bacterium]